ncbi:MAG: hypothetical protein IAF38_08735 [Bacteroidia bacterium]|nr:hypothetical protein [Bacteroidia bacterium]
MASVIFFTIFFSILALIAGLVLFIVGAAGSKKKMRNAGMIIALTAFCLLIGGIYYGASSASSFIDKSIAQADSSSKAREKLLDEIENNWNNENGSDPEHVRYLKSLTKIEDRPFVRKRFFAGLNVSLNNRFPLIFPYAIQNSSFGSDFALVDETAFMDSRSQKENTENVVLNVTHLAFDENVILLKTADFDTETGRNSKNVKYFLVEFSKPGLKQFQTEKELLNEAEKTGYKGSYDFYTVEEYIQKFPLSNADYNQ